MLIELELVFKLLINRLDKDFFMCCNFNKFIVGYFRRGWSVTHRV